MMRKAPCSKKNKVNLTVIKVTAIEKREKAKLQLQHKEKIEMFYGEELKEHAKLVA